MKTNKLTVISYSNRPTDRQIDKESAIIYRGGGKGGGGVVGTFVGLVGDQVNLFATQPKSSDPQRINNGQPLV